MIKVGSVQINASFSNQEYLPYSIGILQAYAQKYCKEIDKFEFLIPIHKRIPVKDAVNHLLKAEIVFFSAYAWNVNLSIEIAKQLKKSNPNVFIVFGGPRIPLNEVDIFLKDNKCIDVAFLGNGEKGFSDILSSFYKKEKITTAGACYFDGEKFIHGGEAPRITDLNTIPSPYLEGTFEPLMKANPEVKWNILWETNRGCPFSCSFCEWGIESKSRVCQFDLDRLCKEIDWVVSKKIEFIRCCDNNFGILERDKEIIKYITKCKKEIGYPQAFSIQTTKNFKDHTYEAYKLLSDAKLNATVTLALQSIYPPTLSAIKRSNIGMEEFKKAQEHLASIDVKTVTDLILGLPEETYESYTNGISTVIEMGQHNKNNLNDLTILPNSDMGDKEYQKKYGMEFIERKPTSVHESVEDEEISESEFVVVGTKSMPKDDWIKSKTFGLSSAFLYYDKVLQVPFILMNKLYKFSFKELIEAFVKNEKYEIIKGIVKFFEDIAKNIQVTGRHIVASKKWLNVWWPPDEFQFIELCANNNLDKFYEEAFSLLKELLIRKGITDTKVIKESITFNKNLIKLPNQKVDKIEKFSYNIGEVYKEILTGKEVKLEEKETTYKFLRSENTWSSWEEWCREVIWFAYKSGGYIYNFQEF
jgi:radical SAM superfamily enzyme YgiQ (UPF0313 family)